MKKFLLALPALAALLTFGSTLNAQYTADSKFALYLDVEGEATTVIRDEDCGYSFPATTGGTNPWGAPVVEDICGEVAWAEGLTSGVIACDSVVSNLAGKIALIRRGTCNFSKKAYLAQQAGAIAVMVVNHSLTATENECSLITMSGGDNYADITIPAVFLSRKSGNPLADALDAGKQVSACFRLLRLYDQFAEYSYAVPVDQISPMDIISMSCVNRTGLAQEFNFKAEITEPSGNLVTLTRTHTIGVDSTQFVIFDAYTPPAEVGTYTIKYSTDKATELGDTLTRSFRITEDSWATDNFTNIGAGPRRDDLFAAGKKYSTASVVRTGATAPTVKYLTFGISNPDTIRVADPLANVVNIGLYDADLNDDGINDMQNGFGDLTPAHQVAFAEFVISEEYNANEMVNAELVSLLGNDDIVLEPNHIYYTVLSYDGNPANTGKMISFTGSDDVSYGGFVDDAGNSLGYSAPIQFSTFSSGWSGVKEVNRLHTAAFDPTTSVKPSLLDKAKYNVTPNPANDQIALNLELSKENTGVRVALADYMGQIISTKIVHNFTTGRITFDTKSLPSGAYSLFITTDEGSTAISVMVCH